MLETMIRELRQAWRAMLRAPGFSAVVIATLGVGLGAAIAVFSMVRALLLEPLPFTDPDRLVLLQTRQGGTTGLISMREVEDLRERRDLFVDIAAHQPGGGGYTMTDGVGPPYEASAILMTSNFFSVLGVPLGRGTSWPGEYDRQRSFGVVLSHRLFRQRFGEDASVFDQTISLDGAPMYTVFGVAPSWFDYPTRTDLYRSLFINDASPNLLERDARNVIGIARLRPGIDRDAAGTEVRGLGQRLAERFPDTNRGVELSLMPMREHWVGDMRPFLLVLVAAVSLVLVLACVNASNLLLARALVREHELAVRRVLGAERARIFSHVLSESITLALAGGLLGTLLAVIAVGGLTRAVRFDLPDWMSVGVDAHALGFGLLLSIGVGLAAGLLPAFRFSRGSMFTAVRAGGRGAAGSRGRRSLSRALVVAQIALALVLLAGTESMVRTFRSLARAELGFDPAGVLTFKVNLPWYTYGADRIETFHAEVTERLRGMPGVREVALSSNIPLASGLQPRRLAAEGQDATAAENNPLVQVSHVSADFFSAMRIELLGGREFGPADRRDGPATAIVSRQLADRLWPGAQPIGRRLRLLSPAAASDEMIDVVGIAADVRRDRLEAPGYDVYLSALRTTPANVHYVLRVGQGEPLRLAAAAERLVWAVDPEQPVWDIDSLEHRWHDHIWRERVAAMLFGAFSLIAVIVAAAGIHGITAFSVRQRSREIGIRMALGARAGRVLLDVLRESGQLAGIGILLGAAGALTFQRGTLALLPGAAAPSAAQLLGAAALLAAVALVASALPARRAARLDPVIALRDE